MRGNCLTAIIWLVVKTHPKDTSQSDNQPQVWLKPSASSWLLESWLPVKNYGLTEETRGAAGNMATNSLWQHSYWCAWGIGSHFWLPAKNKLYRRLWDRSLKHWLGIMWLICLCFSVGRLDIWMVRCGLHNRCWTLLCHVFYWVLRLLICHFDSMVLPWF